jgi:hypothetical protein
MYIIYIASSLDKEASSLTCPRAMSDVMSFLKKKDGYISSLILKNKTDDQKVTKPERNGSKT